MRPLLSKFCASGQVEVVKMFAEGSVNRLAVLGWSWHSTFTHSNSSVLIHSVIMWLPSELVLSSIATWILTLEFKHSLRF